MSDVTPTDRGPVRDGWCCWTCADIAEATVPDYLRRALETYVEDK